MERRTASRQPFSSASLQRGALETKALHWEQTYLKSQNLIWEAFFVIPKYINKQDSTIHFVCCNPTDVTPLPKSSLHTYNSYRRCKPTTTASVTGTAAIPTRRLPTSDNGILWISHITCHNFSNTSAFFPAQEVLKTITFNKFLSDRLLDMAQSH